MGKQGAFCGENASPFEHTVVAETADPHQFYEPQLQHETTQVFWTAEVEALCKVFYVPEAKQTAADQAEMYWQLNPGVDRFKASPTRSRTNFAAICPAT